MRFEVIVSNEIVINEPCRCDYDL